ncbi:MAG: hypothetical protein IJ711_05350 [Lachnospiraceae bacterium]|nr:hypothetical protein [Lachnospiraceae bacterium]
MDVSDIAVLIPAFRPEETLLLHIRELKEAGFVWIVVVDDGSGNEYRKLFRKAKELGCVFARHKSHVGRGAAVRSALWMALLTGEKHDGFVLPCAPGKLSPKQLKSVAERMKEKPGSLVLGGSGGDADSLPGERLPESIGIPPCLLELALCTEEDGENYEKSFLAQAAHSNSFVVL